jgi:hypothetical protein
VILHRQIISGKKKVTIRPFGDLQFGTAGFQEGLWQRWVKEAKADDGAVIIGMGDYSDSFRPTIQKRLRGMFVDDSSAAEQLDEMLLKQTQNIAERLSPVKDKIVGLLEGHHFHRFNNSDITTTQYLCQLLKVKYLGFVSCIQLVIRTDPNTSRPLNIFATHGSGGSKYSYSDASKLERDIMPFWGADLFIRGHSTKVYAVPGSPMYEFSENVRQDCAPLKVHKRNRLLVNTGGFMEGYVQDKSSYVEEKGLPSCALGYATIEVTCVNKGKDGERERVWEMKPTITTQ